jgi:hypothetical protein
LDTDYEAFLFTFQEVSKFKPSIELAFQFAIMITLNQRCRYHDPEIEFHYSTGHNEVRRYTKPTKSKVAVVKGF